MDEARKSLSRKIPIASKKINPYRIVIILRLIIIGFFLHYRLLNPVENAYALWLISVLCEVCFTVSWILDQLPKWYPIERETFLDRLSLRYEKEEEQSQLADIDVFINTEDPKKEHPLITANAVLSVLAVDYPAHKVSCYVSDDGAAMLTFEALSETSLFAKKWVPFCKEFNIEPRAPESFKSCFFMFVLHMLEQVFLGHGDSLDENGDNLPRLVYVSREKRPGFNHHKKAGAVNALVMYFPSPPSL